MKYLNFLSVLVCFVLFNGLTAQCDSVIIWGDFTVSSNTTMSGSYYYTGNFVVESNVTVTVAPYSNGSCGELNIYANKIEINGSINADGAGYAGGSGGAYGTLVSSSTGDASALTDCSNTGDPGHVEVEGGKGGNDGNGSGGGDGGKDGRAGSGSKQECGVFNDWAGVVGAGSGGSSGGGASYGGYGETGGFAGDGSNSYSNDPSITVSNSFVITAGYGKSGGSPGVTYGTDDQAEIYLGSGGGGSGGGGRSYSQGSSGNSGGSGGGLVSLTAYTDSLIITGSISVNGANGSTGGVGGNGGIGTDSGGGGCCWDGNYDCGEDTYSCGAGGGGGAGGGSGGGIKLVGNSINYITGSLYSQGGDGGSGSSGGQGTSCGSTDVITNSGNSGDSGGGGGGGRIKIFASDCFGNIVLPNTDLLGGNGINFADEGYLHVDNNLPCQGATPPPTGIGEILFNSNLEFNIFPNPANDIINIKFLNSFVNLDHGLLKVYDVFGQNVISHVLDNNSWLNLNMDVSSLDNGVYLITIELDNYIGDQIFTVVR